MRYFKHRHNNIKYTSNRYYIVEGKDVYINEAPYTVWVKHRVLSKKSELKKIIPITEEDRDKIPKIHNKDEIQYYVASPEQLAQEKRQREARYAQLDAMFRDSYISDLSVLSPSDIFNL